MCVGGSSCTRERSTSSTASRAKIMECNVDLKSRPSWLAAEPVRVLFADLGVLIVGSQSSENLRKFAKILEKILFF